MYAINQTNTGFRAINSQADLLAGETLSNTQPVLNNTLPDVSGFIAALLAIINIVQAANITGSSLMFSALQAGNWQGASDLIENALKLTQITTAQHEAIKAAALTFNIPITLP